MTVAPKGHYFRASVTDSRNGRRLYLTGRLQNRHELRLIVKGVRIQDFCRTFRDGVGLGLDIAEGRVPLYTAQVFASRRPPGLDWHLVPTFDDRGALSYLLEHRDPHNGAVWLCESVLTRDEGHELGAFLGGVAGRCMTDSGTWAEVSEGLYE